MKAPKPLIEDIEAGQCVPFVGAGFSMNGIVRGGGTMPDWASLTAHLAGIIGGSPEIGGPAIALAFEKKFGRVQLIESIRTALHTDRVEPGPTQ